MATRRERVVLELEDNFSSGMARAAAMTALLDKELGSLSGSAVQSRTAMRTTSSDVDKVGASSASAGDSINQLTGRLRLAVDAIALLGPALVPIGAVAIPAIAGLANQMGILAVGAGTAVLAFQGVGEAFKGIEKARLDPSIKNLAEVQRLMSDLEPAARGFVEQIDSMRPAFDGIQNSAAAGLFPGFTEGLADLESMAGPVRRAVGDIAAGFGDAAAAEADAFDSERGREFIAFLGNEAPQTLSKLFETVRNLAAGMGELWMTFDAPNDDFADWLLGQSQAFDEWSQSLGETQGFEDFLNYISTTGPKVADALGAIGNMVVQIVEAAAPLGGPVLEGLEFFADVVATIADSDIGAPLVAAAAAAALLNRGLQLTAKLLPAAAAPIPATAAGVPATTATKAPVAAAPIGFGSAGKQATQISSQLGVLQTRATAAQGAVRTLGNALAFSAYSGATLAKSAASTSAAVSTSAQKAIAARSAVGGYGGAAAKTGAAVGAMAVLSTEAGQGLGVTNTALLGMTGAMAGPWGAAVGAGVGLILDFAAASGDANEAIKKMNSAVADAGNDFGTLNDLTANGNESTTAFIDGMSGVGKAYQALDEALTGENAIDAFRESADEAEEQARDMISAFQDVAVAAGFETKDDIGRNILPSMKELQAVAESAAPALEALNIDPADPAAISAGADAIVSWMRHADSAAGRTEAFAKSVADLGNDALSTADSAAAFSTAIQSMLAPALGAEAATDSWRQSLMGLKGALVDGAGFEGFTKGALANKAATRDYANTSMERLTALAQISTTTEGDMARAVSATRREFIKSAVAAGLDRKAVIARANAMGLTPKMVRTVFEAAGIDKADLQIREARKNIESLPKKVQTEIRANGIPKTMGEINGLTKRLDLTEKQRQALITLKDLASKGLRIVDGKLKAIDGNKAEPKVDLNKAPFDAVSRAIMAGVRNLDRQKPRPTADMNDNPFQGRRAAVMAALGVTDRYTANPTVNLTDNASGKARSIQASINAIQGKTVEIVVNTFRNVFGNKNENGGLYDGPVRAFADGGFGANGRYYSRVPQIVPGGADIQWGEKSTGWEAYISGKPGQRDRNIAILNEAASRLGVEQPARPVAMAPRAQGGGRQSIRVDFSPAMVEIRTPDGRKQVAELRAIARSEFASMERDDEREVR